MTDNTRWQCDNAPNSNVEQQWESVEFKGTETKRIYYCEHRDNDESAQYYQALAHKASTRMSILTRSELLDIR